MLIKGAAGHNEQTCEMSLASLDYGVKSAKKKFQKLSKAKGIINGMYSLPVSQHHACFCFERKGLAPLTHWGQVTHICLSKLTIIGSDNGLSPGGRQAIIWTNAGILLIRPSGTNFNERLIEILTFHSWKCIWKCRLRNGVHFVSASMC